MIQCPLLDMHVAVSPSGLIQPCCRFLVDKHQEAFFNMSDVTLAEGQRAPGFEAARTSFARGEFPAGCSSCAFEEKNGIVSMREKAVRDYPHANSLEFIEFFLGNLCNMKCRTCDPQHSSRWERDAALFEWKAKSPHHVDVKKILASVDLKKIRRLKLLGGEPFYSKTFYELLDHIIECAEPSRVALELNTNVSLFPTPAVLNQLARFRKVELNLSIDEVGAKAEFLRTGTVWSVVDKNLSLWQTAAKTYSNIKINVHTTVSAYNVLHIHQVIVHLLDRGFKDLSVMSVKTPTQLSPLRIPLDLRRQAWPAMETAIRGRTESAFVNRLKNIVLVPEELDSQEFVAYSALLDGVYDESGITVGAPIELPSTSMG